MSDKPGFIKAYEKSKIEEQEILIKGLSIRDRLMRRTKLTVLDVPFKDDLGEFNVKCRMLMESEQRKFIELQEQLSKVIKKEDYGQVMREIYEVLAYPNGVCLDKELDLQFWENGAYSSDLVLVLVANIMKKTSLLASETNSFRQK